MAGEQESPWRAPCGGWPAPKFLGEKYQHYRASENGIARFINVTEIDGAPPEDGDPGPADACSATEIDGNCYEQSGTIDYATCHKSGWKAVNASKFFHGRFGLTDDVLCGGCTAVTSKFRAVRRHVVHDYSATYDNGSTTETMTQSADIEKLSTVGKNSGVITISECDDTYSTSGSLSVGLGVPLIWDQLLGLFFVTSTCSGTIGVDDSQVPPGGTEATPPDMAFFPNGETPANLVTALEAGNYDNGTGFLEHSGTASLVNNRLYVRDDWKHGINERWNGSDWEEIGTPATHGHASGYWEVEVLLTLEQTPDGLLAEIDTDLLSEWDLSDDVQYPWRTDTDCLNVPLVIHNEVQLAVDPEEGMIGLGDGDTWCGWVDPNAATYDGAVIGEPLPSGYGPHYSFILQEWSVSPLPITATHWGDPSDKAQDGGFIHWDGAALHVRKFAMTQGVWPSYNFSRPCGDDATAIWQADPDFCTDPQLRFPSAAACDPDYEWNDDQPKGDYVVLEFEDDYCESTKTFACTQRCLEFNACCPSVLSVGCDSIEDFCHGYNTAFPVDFEPVYQGWRWSRIPVASMPDPLFEVPHLDCDTNEQPAYTIPYVEARCSAPTGAPAMPTNPDSSAIIFGCPSEAGWCSQPADNTCYGRAEEDI